MVSVAVGDGSAPSWESHHDLRRHYQTFFDGYDRQRGVEVMQKYVRRGKEAESVEAAAAHPGPPKLCIGCRASKTPLWRKGPSGPKSLCNACGIRYKRKTGVGSNGDGGGPKKLNSDRAAGKPLWVSSEELKQKQKEKQKRLLLALMQRQRQRNARRTRAGRRPAAVAEGGGRGGGGRDEAEEAALLLLSLSSGIFVR